MGWIDYGERNIMKDNERIMAAANALAGCAGLCFSSKLHPQEIIRATRAIDAADLYDAENGPTDAMVEAACREIWGDNYGCGPNTERSSVKMLAAIKAAFRIRAQGQ
jgi:hypothetical protein